MTGQTEILVKTIDLGAGLRIDIVKLGDLTEYEAYVVAEEGGRGRISSSSRLGIVEIDAETVEKAVRWVLPILISRAVDGVKDALKRRRR